VLAGAALKALGRTAEARAALELGLKMDPQSELARSQLAELNSVHERLRAVLAFANVMRRKKESTANLSRVHAAFPKGQ